MTDLSQTINVSTPDGSTFSFPAGTPRDEIMSAIDTHFGRGARAPGKLVTDPALLRHLRRARRFAMAGGALQLTVGSQQRKMRFLGMIEHPQRPPVRRMAAVAFLAETPLVHIIVGMAVDAGRRRPAEGQGPVALSTADHSVQSQQREFARDGVTEGAYAAAMLEVVQDGGRRDAITSSGEETRVRTGSHWLSSRQR